MSGVLYVSYDGMLEPLGQSQVLAYLELLAADHRIFLVSFEKARDWNDAPRRARIQSRLDAAGIEWHPRRYHKAPTAIATTWDICTGIVIGIWLVLKYRLNIVHARSYVPAVMALAVKRVTRARFLFDMRGFWADERVDGGIWLQDGWLFRLAKWFERRFLLATDHVVSLTDAAAREIESFSYLATCRPPITVIPTCADLARFRPAKVRNRQDGFVLGYVGAAGTWYLFNVVADTFAQLLVIRPEAFLLVINRNEHEQIRTILRAAGIPEQSFAIKSVDHGDVHNELQQMDAGVFFYKPSYSRIACAPTKLGELLGCGCPCLSNRGVGDMAEILEGAAVGIAVESFGQEALKAGLQGLLELLESHGIRQRCRDVAEQYFSLDAGVQRYAQIYQSLSSICAA